MRFLSYEKNEVSNPPNDKCYGSDILHQPTVVAMIQVNTAIRNMYNDQTAKSI